MPAMLNMVSLLLISVPVGFIGSLTGLGGASILVPLLVFFGIPVKEAIASAMVTIYSDFQRFCIVVRKEEDYQREGCNVS
jgi:uncharacterized membrane protein YfcA